MLRLHAAAHEAMKQHAEEGYPHEVIGLLVGERATGDVTEVVPLVNERADSAHNRYRVSGLILMRAEQAVEARGKEVVGYYHSHPDHPADYSEYDREHALPNMSYPILAVHDGAVVDLKAWRLTDDRSAMVPEAIENVG